jgi:glutaredoxin
MNKIVLLALWLHLMPLAAPSPASEADESSTRQTVLSPKTTQSEETPVVIYTLSTCPYCREAKEYLANNKIPFINREVDLDEEHMATLMKIYDEMGVPEGKRGVPLIVVGNRIRIQGLNKEKLRNALKEVMPNR